MSVQRGFGFNGRAYYCNVSYPSEVFCQFKVDSTNSNGLGISSLKSNGYIRNVFMHTSATPASNDNYTNPNPAAGYAFVQFRSNFNAYLITAASQVAVNQNTSTSSITAGNPYIITSLGTTTLAQWQTAGVPKGFTPTVNQSFIALATGAIGGTGTVGTPGIPGTWIVAPIGDPNQEIANSAIEPNGGAIILLGFYAPTSSSVTTGLATAPPDGTIMSLRFTYDRGSVTVDGL